MNVRARSRKEQVQTVLEQSIVRNFCNTYVSWLVDSRIAINRVQQFMTSKDYRPTTQPDNIDLLSAIRDLHRELRRPLKKQWIKSHQDDSTTYEKLSPDAKLNVDADELATAAHKRKRSQPL